MDAHFLLFFMQEVKIIDKFLTNLEMNNIWNVISNMSWKMQTSIVNKSGLDFLTSDVSDLEYFNSYLFNRIKKSLGIDVKLDRVYFNGQWHGREGEIHEDGCDVTALIYVSEYQSHWGGFTQVFLPNKEVIISPQQGRLMSFPGHCAHKGYSFSYQECPMRISLAYKMFYI